MRSIFMRTLLKRLLKFALIGIKFRYLFLESLNFLRSVCKVRDSFSFFSFFNPLMCRFASPFLLNEAEFPLEVSQLPVILPYQRLDLLHLPLKRYYFLLLSGFLLTLDTLFGRLFFAHGFLPRALLRFSVKRRSAGEGCHTLKYPSPTSGARAAGISRCGSPSSLPLLPAYPLRRGTRRPLPPRDQG